VRSDAARDSKGHDVDVTAFALAEVLMRQYLEFSLREIFPERCTAAQVTKRLKIQNQHRAQLKLADDILDAERSLASMSGEQKADLESALKAMRQQVKPDKVATRRGYANSQVVRDALQTWMRLRGLHSLLGLTAQRRPPHPRPPPPRLGLRIRGPPMRRFPQPRPPCSLVGASSSGKKEEKTKKNPRTPTLVFISVIRYASRTNFVRRTGRYHGDHELPRQSPRNSAFRESVLFIGTQFSILYTFMYSPA
jgi:hypothetical protein